MWESTTIDVFREEGSIPRRRDTFPPRPPRRPRPQETGSWGRTPGPPNGKSPRLQAFGEKAILQQECPLKSPRVNQPWPLSG